MTLTKRRIGKRFSEISSHYKPINLRSEAKRVMDEWAWQDAEQLMRDGWLAVVFDPEQQLEYANAS